MPRGKIQMSLIGDARDRAKAFARRKAGLVKKARELAKLCGVDVALVVCAGPDGGAAPVVWESDPGVVIDRYRRLPADKRAEHTHLGYLNGQLGKEEHRLAKKRRQGLNALACPGEAMLRDMDLEELLASIDVALLATAERQKALGIADDGGQQLGQQVSSDAVVPVVAQGDPPFVGGDNLDDIQAWVDELMWPGAEPLPLNNASMMQPASGVIQDINGNDVDMGSNHQCQAQAPPGDGENGHEQLSWHAYQLNTTTSYPDYYGFQCAGNNYVDMDEYSQMPVPSNASAAYDGWYDQASWGADESSCDAVTVLPAAAYPYLDIAGNPAYMPRQHKHPSMAIGGLMDAGGHEYETGCLADYLHCPDPSQHFGEEPEPLHYLSDMTQGISCYESMMISKQAAAAPGELNSLLKVTAALGHYSLVVQTSEQSQSDMGQQYQDPGVQRFWVMEGKNTLQHGPPGSTAVATANARVGGTWANTKVFTNQVYQFINRLS